jgi:tetratricopeptide (TPR) repeat protein
VKEAAARALRAAPEIEANDFDAAIDDLDKAIALDSSKAFYREIKARTLYFSGDYSGALVSYRRLESDGMSDERAPVIATLEYLAGDRQRAISFYRSAHQSGPPGNVFLFYAALIQSELEGGKVDAFGGLHFGSLEGPFAEALLSYRLGTVDAAALLDSARRLPVGGDQATCMAEFNIGHRLALQQTPIDAIPAFRSAVELCPKTKFEYHAAKAWLKRLGV